MKIAITGHKHGLGAALYDKFTIYNRSAGHEVVGYDIEDGYDIGNRSTIGKLVYNTKDADIFVNNAYHETGQTELLKYLLKSWHQQKKIIVHIGTFLIKPEGRIGEGPLPMHQLYVKNKLEQQQLIEEHRLTDHNLKIIQINPGYMLTGFLDKMKVPELPYGLNVIDCADAIVTAIDLLDKNIYIPELTLIDKRD